MAKRKKKTASQKKQMDYQNKYNREVYKQYHFRVRRDDTELIEAIAKINEEKALSSYLRELIRKDLKMEN